MIILSVFRPYEYKKEATPFEGVASQELLSLFAFLGRLLCRFLHFFLCHIFVFLGLRPFI